MLILGIETSCDETAAAIVQQKNGRFSVLSNIVSSQVKLHAQWGGVVPNLAAREHLKNIVPVIEKSLAEANLKPQDIDLIAVTNGPGLIPALLIGTAAAKTLSYLWQKPLVGIHHIEGHICANFIQSHNPTPSPACGRGWLKEPGEGKRIQFPLLCLVVSGGHTQLIFMKKALDYEIVGETLDDAGGEAFDKVARILNLGYPGGPAIAKEAENFPHPPTPSPASGRGWTREARPGEGIKLPRPMITSPDFNFSFSGLKTAVLYLAKKNEKLLKNEKFVNEVCHEFQQAVIDVLIKKTLAAAKKYQPRTICIAGGVSANQELRRQLASAVEKNLKNISFIMPAMAYSVDNATMIAVAGFLRWEKNNQQKNFQKTIRENWQNLQTDANLKLE